MQFPSNTQREEVQDIWYGQVVTTVGRWFLIGAALFLTLWRGESVGDVQVNSMFIMLLVGMNFYLHGRFLMNRPVHKLMVYATSVMDLVIVSMIILTAGWGAASGIENPYYVFYYPVLLAFALVFPPRATLGFAGLAVAAYAVISLVTGPGLDLAQGHEEVLGMRLVTMATIAVLGTMYWRIQRRHRGERLTGRIRA